MRPILLKGHERALTCVIYNREGDLIFTAAKDHIPVVWYADSGERVGTYVGHQGAVWELSVSWDSKYLLSASADATARLWEVETGETLAIYSHNGPVRSVCWAEGGEKFASASDPFVKQPGYISVFSTPRGADPTQFDTLPVMKIEQIGKIRVSKVLWGAMNEYLIVGYDDGSIVLYDAVDGSELMRRAVHAGAVNRLYLNKDKTLLLSCSKDYTAKLLNAKTLEEIKNYQTDRPVNAAVIHPTKEHILLGGGQDAMTVTTTKSSVGKFETRFYHMIYAEEFGRVKGHFGPINCLAVNPDGKSYCSGAEDGYTRLHHFDGDYLTKTDEVPDELEPPAES